MDGGDVNDGIGTAVSSFAMAVGGPGVEHNTQAFLEALAKGGGQPLETLSTADARAVLVGAQKSAELQPADVSEKTIQIDGKPLKLTIVRPAGVKEVLPAFMFFHGPVRHDKSAKRIIHAREKRVAPVQQTPVQHFGHVAQRVACYASVDELEGTARGAWQLTRWGQPADAAFLQQAHALGVPALADYALAWQQRLDREPFSTGMQGMDRGAQFKLSLTRFNGATGEVLRLVR